jgi:hypothetical protein
VQDAALVQQDEPHGLAELHGDLGRLEGEFGHHDRDRPIDIGVGFIAVRFRACFGVFVLG